MTNRKKRILFFGLGSIGKRHLKILKKNYDYEIYAYRTNRNNPEPNIINIYDLNKALKVEPDIAFITNPSYLHVKTAITCLHSGIKNFFIEKPLSSTLEDLNFFLEEVKKSNALVYVGYSMRHNPILKRIKEMVEEKKKDIFYAQTVCSSYLPNWRLDRDYRDVYSAKSKQGGGVILELIHEFDYNEWLFGKIKSISGVYGKISNLEIDSEDFCDVTLKFEDNMIASIHLDYFSFNEQRIIKILTNEEEIIADLINNEISLINNRRKTAEKFRFERNDYFEQQLKYFLDGVESKSNKIDNLNDAKELLEKLLEFKKKIK